MNAAALDAVTLEYGPVRVGVVVAYLHRYGWPQQRRPFFRLLPGSPASLPVMARTARKAPGATRNSRKQRGSATHCVAAELSTDHRVLHRSSTGLTARRLCAKKRRKRLRTF